MILPIHKLVRARMAEAVGRLYDIPDTDPVLAAIPVEPAPRRALGDLAVPLAFELARRLGSPRAIAQESPPRLAPSRASLESTRRRTGTSISSSIAPPF